LLDQRVGRGDYAAVDNRLGNEDPIEGVLVDFGQASKGTRVESVAALDCPSGSMPISRCRLSLDLVTLPQHSDGMIRVTTHEAKTHLSRLIANVQAGEEVLICKGSTPAAKLTAVHAAAAPSRPLRPRVGTVTSEPVGLAADAFAPLGPDELGEWGL
jgi:antitoxin (DNA-binding transcriptional repressor) of toxin-antitoxin stability system